MKSARPSSALPLPFKKVRPSYRNLLKHPRMAELLRIDSHIHSLKAEIEGCDRELVSSHQLAVRHDELVTLYSNRVELSRRRSDRATALQHNSIAIDLARTSLSSEGREQVTSGELGRRWSLQGARLAWRASSYDNGDQKADKETTIGAIDQAIHAYDQALLLLPRIESGLRREVAHNGANLYGGRFDLTQDAHDIDEAIKRGSIALDAADSEPSTFSIICNDIGVLYQQKGQVSREVVDLQRAVELGICAASDVSCSDHSRVKRILNLQFSRRLLFGVTKDVSQLFEARSELLRAIELCEHGQGRETSQAMVRLAAVSYLLDNETSDASYRAEAEIYARNGLANAKADGIADERSELVLLIATILSENDQHGRSIDELAGILREGGNPIL